MPSELFTFRDNYKKGRIQDLSILYNLESNFYIEHTSNDTDINSLHLELIKNYTDAHKPHNFQDVGCGTGFLLELLDKKLIRCKLGGIDFSCRGYSVVSFSNKVNFIDDDINNQLQTISNNSFDVVICAHVFEHLSNPKMYLKKWEEFVKSF